MCCPRTSLKSTPSALALAEQLGGRDLQGSYAVSGVDELHDFHQRAHGKDVHALHHRRLAGIDLGHQQVRDLLGARRNGDGKRAADAAQAAIKRQLADHHVIVQLALVQRAVSPQDAEGHRQIETRSLFLHVRGSEIDRDVSWRNVVPGILQRGANPLTALTHGRIGQADGSEVVFSELHARNIDFDIDEVGVDAVNGGGKSLEEHKERGNDYGYHIPNSRPMLLVTVACDDPGAVNAWEPVLLAAYLARGLA